MEYRQKEPNPESHDHDNSDYVLTNGLAPELAQRAFDYLESRENLQDLVRFEGMLNILKELVQDPKPADMELAGYTAHRRVKFADPNIEYALCFHLQRPSYGQERIITALWRRIYPEYDRRAVRETGEDQFRRSDFVNNNQSKHCDLLRLEFLYDTYLKAPSYGDSIEFPAAS